MQKISNLYSVLLLLVILVSPIYGQIECDPETIYFEQQVLPILLSNCAYSACHNAQSHQHGVVLDGYNNIMNVVEPGNSNFSELFDVLTSNNDLMPPPPELPLTEEQIDLIGTWIDQGAENNSCEPGLDGCDTLNLDLAVEQILQKNCIGCHSGEFPSSEIDFSTPSDFQATVESGSFFGAIFHEAQYFDMPPSFELTECEINQIEAYMNNMNAIDEDNDGVLEENDCDDNNSSIGGIGSACEDFDPCTDNDALDANCFCTGTMMPDSDNDGDCDAVDVCPNLASLLPGDNCDDGDLNTENDIVNENCECLGTSVGIEELQLSSPFLIHQTEFDIRVIAKSEMNNVSQVSLMNLHGQTVIVSQQSWIDLSNINEGIYFLMVKEVNGKYWVHQLVYY